MKGIVYKYGKIKKRQGGNRMSLDLGSYIYKNMLKKLHTTNGKLLWIVLKEP